MRLRREIHHTPGSLGNLRAHRSEAGLSQSELAELAGVGFMTVVRAEGGRHINTASLEKLAAALNVNPADLLTPTEDEDM